MCLALYKPAGMRLTRAILQRAYAANPDGCGLATLVKGRLILTKGLWTFPTFWARLQAAGDGPALVHMRYATAGTISQANCHPFRVGAVALIHNGHLNGFGTATRSDTAHWCQAVLAPALRQAPNMLQHPACVHQLEATIGTSKMVLMDQAGTVTILNAARGVWQDGCWYSTARFLPRQYPTKRV